MAHAVPKLFCFYCKTDAHPQTPWDQIQAGDFHVCAFCGAVWVYEPDLSFRPPEFDEISELDAETLFAIMERQQEVFATGQSPLFDEIQKTFDQVQTAYKRHTYN